MARPERLNHCTGLDSSREETDRSVKAPVGGQLVQTLESRTHLPRKIAHQGGDGALRHRSASSWGAALSGWVDAPATVADAGGGVRRGRRCEETARADAASLALDRSKFSWATSR